MIDQVELSSNAKKDIKKAPKHIVVKLLSWIDSVEEYGLAITSKIKGYNDEPLKGKRKGQRSIRLSKAYRAIYVIKGDEIEFVLIEEVDKHDY
jgi:proteic killer suppression protein